MHQLSSKGSSRCWCFKLLQDGTMWHGPWNVSWFMSLVNCSPTIHWLVVSNLNFIFHFIYGMSSFPLTFIFFKMVDTANQFIYIYSTCMYLSTNLARHHLAPGDRQNHPSGQVHHFWLGKPLVSHYTWVKITSFLGEIPFNFCQITLW